LDGATKKKREFSLCVCVFVCVKLDNLPHVKASNDPLDAIFETGLETYAAKAFDKIFSNKETRQGVKVSRRFRDRLRP
jgi:hypothetical protein